MSPAVIGCLVGTAVGDALGLPYEGLSPRRARLLFGGPLRHRFLFGHGMVSDDTEHTCMTLLSLMDAKGDVDRFRRVLARRMRFWLLAVPAGAGLATLRATLRLWVGVSPARSGVESAGNGACMRAAVIGAWFASDPMLRVQFVEASSRITHSDVRAVEGAQVVGLAAACSANENPGAFEMSEFAKHLSWDEPNTFEKGVSGYVVTTVQAVIQVWRAHPGDYRAAMEEAIGLGGDADTVGAILGGIIGAGVGVDGIPGDWREGLWEWPRGIRWMQKPGRFAWYLIPFRNLLFLVVVLTHGFRRLAPPY